MIEIFIAFFPFPFPFPFRFLSPRRSIGDTFLPLLPRVRGKRKKNRGFRFAVERGECSVTNLHDKAVVQLDSTSLSGSSVVGVFRSRIPFIPFTFSSCRTRALSLKILSTGERLPVIERKRRILADCTDYLQGIEDFNCSDTDRYFQLDLATAWTEGKRLKRKENHFVRPSL